MKSEIKSLKKQICCIREYAKWHVDACTDDILDYIDDDRIGNKDFIDELREDREHWKDVVKLCDNDFSLYMNNVISRFNSDN